MSSTPSFKSDTSLNNRSVPVITIPKLNKPLDDPKSFQPISLLPTISKVFEKF